MQNFLPVLILAIFCARTVRADNGVDFVRDIPPIFRDACVECHGPDKQKGSRRFSWCHSPVNGA